MLSHKLNLICTFLFVLISTLFVQAQSSENITYIDGRSLTVLGRPNSVNPDSFHRIANEKLNLIPELVKSLSGNSAGINICFQTNSPNIHLKWKLEKLNSWWNMTSIAVNGIDLYGRRNNEWQYVGSAKPVSESNDFTIAKNLDGQLRHYLLYLPLYSEVTSLEIGVDSEAIIMPADPDILPTRKVVIYGSSITQGASASRPGMTYSSIIGRCLNIETFNMGFSGSGKMEIEMAGIIAEMPADLFILDCVPNSSPEEIKLRTIPFVRLLRETNPDVPILMVESIFREGGYWDSEIGSRVKEQNRVFKEAYEALKNSDMKLLFYLETDNLLGKDHEATIDGTHPSDLGHKRIASIMCEEVEKILNN